MIVCDRCKEKIITIGCNCLVNTKSSLGVDAIWDGHLCQSCRCILKDGMKAFLFDFLNPAKAKNG